MLGMVCVVLLARWIDDRRVALPTVVEQERLYMTGNTVRRMSLSFNGLTADWYWMRSLQYVGRKIMNVPENIPIDDLGQLDLKLLAPLIDTATTLDPQFLEPYEYAAVVLPSIDVQEAIRITKKGVDANPNAWKLYQHLGYIYWQQRDYKTASETYSKGAAIPGAPAWMQAMSARMAAEGGSRAVAREIYTRMYEQAADDSVRDMARRRLLQVDAFDQQDVLRQILSAYKQRSGHCPNSWREVEPVLRTLRWPVDQSGSPFDPAGFAYKLDNKTCEAVLDEKSEVPGR
jgi:tetratricopeptide (TPR) repeat protein